MVKTENISSSTGNSDDSFFLGYAIGKKKGGGGGEIRGSIADLYNRQLFNIDPVIGELIEE